MNFSKNFVLAAWQIISNQFSFQNLTKICCLRIALVAQNPIPRIFLTNEPLFADTR
jgi:hypothetical protein